MSRQNETEYFIPKISDASIKMMLKQMWPVVRFDSDGRRDPSGAPYFIYMEDARTIAFTWDPEPSDEAKGLVELTRIRTLHTYGYYGMFKPSVAEVLAQIPEHLIDQVVAFETHGPEYASDLNREIDALNAGFHVAETILYGRA